MAATEAFAAEARIAGATIEIETAVRGLRRSPGGGWEVTVDRRPGSAEAPPGASVLGADAVIIAAGPWSAELGSMVGVRVPVVAVRGQMWASAAQPPLLRHAIASAESLLAWSDEARTGLIAQTEGDEIPPQLTHSGADRLTRHLYGRQRQNGEIVFGGDRVLTTDRSVDQDGITVNHDHVAELLPPVRTLPPARTWAGLMPFSIDGRPLIGPVPDNDGLFLAGGLASSGFGRGPMTGRLAAELVLGRTPDYDLTSVSPAGRVDPLD